VQSAPFVAHSAKRRNGRGRQTDKDKFVRTSMLRLQQQQMLLHSALIDRTNRSAYAFALGARGSEDDVDPRVPESTPHVTAPVPANNSVPVATIDLAGFRG
jgi:hypothetical protein